jgi:hypothetical protein
MKDFDLNGLHIESAFFFTQQHILTSCGHWLADDGTITFREFVETMAARLYAGFPFPELVQNTLGLLGLPVPVVHVVGFPSTSTSFDPSASTANESKVTPVSPKEYPIQDHPRYHCSAVEPLAIASPSRPSPPISSSGPTARPIIHARYTPQSYRHHLHLHHHLLVHLVMPVQVQALIILVIVLQMVLQAKTPATPGILQRTPLRTWLWMLVLLHCRYICGYQ